MERSAIPFVEEGLTFFDKLRAPEISAPFEVDKPLYREYNVLKKGEARYEGPPYWENSL